MKSSDEKFIVLFDGVCNYCNAMVNLIIRFDPQEKFLFSSLQSHSAQKLMNGENWPENSIVLIVHNRKYFKSTAILKIAKILGGLLLVFYPFILLPEFIRDALYSLFARNRYSLFGKRNECRIPEANISHRFLKD